MPPTGPAPVEIEVSGFDHSGCHAEPVDPKLLDLCRQVLDRIAYKPGSSFELRDGGDLMLTTVEYDRRTGDRLPMVFNDEAFTARVQALMAERGFGLEQAVLGSFREAVLTEERHECNEWITLDREDHFNPHSPSDLGLAIIVHGANIDP